MPKKIIQLHTYWFKSRFPSDMRKNTYRKYNSPTYACLALSEINKTVLYIVYCLYRNAKHCINRVDQWYYMSITPLKGMLVGFFVGFVCVFFVAFRASRVERNHLHCPLYCVRIFTYLVFFPSYWRMSRKGSVHTDTADLIRHKEFHARHGFHISSFLEMFKPGLHLWESS